MGGLYVVLIALVVWTAPIVSLAEERLVHLHAHPALVETGVLKHALPRFSLKTQVRVALVDEASAADIVLGSTGRALFEGAGQVWHMKVRNADHAGTKRLADWLTSEVGQRTILGYAPDGVALFAPPSESRAETVALSIDGDVALGLQVSRTRCARCHKVDESRKVAGIGSTPSFSVLRSLGDWEERFGAFYALNPHPSFTIIKDVTPPFPEDRPPPIVPIELTQDEVEAVLAYVAAMQGADLGAPLQPN